MFAGVTIFVAVTKSAVASSRKLSVAIRGRSDDGRHFPLRCCKYITVAEVQLAARAVTPVPSH